MKPYEFIKFHKIKQDPQGKGFTMTKLQMKNEALNILDNNKASKALKAALTDLFEQYASTAKGETVKRPQHIEIDGVHYRWCNRHTVYEVATNFKKNPRDCMVAYKHWTNLGGEVKQLTDKLMSKALEGEDTQEIAVELKEAKEIRGGRYSREANILQYADIEDYDYDSPTYAEIPENAKILEQD